MGVSQKLESLRRIFGRLPVELVAAPVIQRALFVGCRKLLPV
jgi:hypothetical protein